jgi:hypothetical protein
MPSRPRIGERVWVHGKQQPNGIIINIVWGTDDPIVVKFYDTNEIDSYSWDEFHDHNDRLQQWILS